MARSPRIRDRPFAYAAASLGAAMLAIYIGVIVGQGGASFFGVLPWATSMVAAVAAALSAAQLRDRRIARNLMIAATVLFLVLGVAGILSIGVGFLLAAVLAGLAALRLSGLRTGSPPSAG